MVTYEVRPFGELEIFEPAKRKQKEYKDYINQIRYILMRNALKNFGIGREEVRKLTIDQIDQEIANLSKTQPLLGIWPPQVEAMAKGFYLEQTIEDYSFYPSAVIATATGTGKTDIAALVGLKALLEGRGKVLYTVPYRALAREKETTFREMWGGLVKPDGSKIQISRQYLDPEGLVTEKPDYSAKDWIIATNEKTDSLIRHENPFLKQLAVLIVDEGDFLGEAGRGPTLETVITRIKQKYSKIQIVFLSATIPAESVRPLALWLNSRPGMNINIENSIIRNIEKYCILTFWRPTKLINSIYLDGHAYNVNCKEKKLEDGGTIAQVESNDILNITLHTLKERGKVLIFRKSRPDAITTAKLIAKAIVSQRILKRTEFERLDMIRIKRETERSAVEEQLSRLVKVGVAFHHAGLPSETLEAIERSFREGDLKVVVATTTLARGVNLPARTVIVGDMVRYDPRYPRIPGIPIKVGEYHQFVGRAGRFGKENIGYGFTVVNNWDAAEDRMVKYVCAKSEEVVSQLYDEPALRKHLLATVAIDKIVGILDFKNFILNTYLNVTEELDTEFWTMVSNIVSFFLEHNFIMRSLTNSDRFEITRLGTATSGFILDPLSVVYLRAGSGLMASDLDAKRGVDELGFLHLISFIESGGYIQSRKTQLVNGWAPPESVFEYNKLNKETLIDLIEVGRDPQRKPIYKIPSMDEIVRSRKYRLYVPVPADRRTIEYEYYLQTLYTAMVLRDWINEIPEDIITQKYIWVQPGDLFRKHETIERIASIFSSLDELPEFAAGISTLCDMIYWRIRKGIKAELISLAKMPDIGRVRARRLYDAGYTDRSTLAHKIVDPIEYEKIQKIVGKRLAKKLLDRLTRPVLAKEYKEMALEDAKLKKGIPPIPKGEVLAEVTDKEELRKDYYDKVLDLMKRMWMDNNMNPILISDIITAANTELNIVPTETEAIIIQMIGTDGVVWVPIKGKVMLFEEK